MSETITQQGTCLICGSGSCPLWRCAALTEDRHVDASALMVAHGVEPAEVAHDEKGQPTSGGAVPLVPMPPKQSALYKKHGGRIAPIPVRKGPRR